MKNNKDTEVKEEAKKSTGYSIQISNLNVRENPGREFNVIGTALQGPVEIIDFYVDQRGIRWGKLAEGGWVDMNFVSED